MSNVSLTALQRISLFNWVIPYICTWRLLIVDGKQTNKPYSLAIISFSSEKNLRIIAFPPLSYVLWWRWWRRRRWWWWWVLQQITSVHLLLVQEGRCSWGFIFISRIVERIYSSGHSASSWPRWLLHHNSERNGDRAWYSKPTPCPISRTHRVAYLLFFAI